MADIENLSQRLASEFARGEADINRPADVPAIPSPGDDILSLKKTVQAIKQLLDAREARSGSVLEKTLTLRELINAGGLNVNLPGFSVTNAGSILTGGAGTAGPPGPAGPPGLPGGGFADPRPILGSAPTPTNLVVRGTFRTVILDWDLVDYQNHAYCEVFRNTVDAIGSAVNVGDTPSRTGPYTDSTAVNGVNYFYWVRAVAIDTAGNLLVGAFNAVNGTQGGPGRIGGTDLNDLIVTADKLADGSVPMVKLAAGIRPPRVVATLPVSPFTGYAAGDTVVLTTDNKLYRFTGTAFTRALDAADITVNQITAGQIAVGAIGATQIAAGAIAAGSAAIANGAIRRALIEDAAIDSAKIDNLAVTTGKIADLAVTGAKIQDATIIDAKIVNLNAGKINAGFISADRIQAGTIDASKINSNGLSIRDTAGNVILSAGSSLATSSFAVPGTVSNVPGGWQNSNITISGGAIQGIGTGAGTAVANSSITIASGAIQGIGTGAGTVVANSAISISGGNISGIGTGDGTAVANNAITITNGAIQGINVAANGTVIANSQISISGGAIQGIGTGAGTLVANNNIVLNGNSGTITLTGGPTGSVTGVIMPGNPVNSGNISTYISSAAISDAYIANLNAAKINAGVLDAARIAAGSIDASKIGANQVTADKVAANAITTRHLAVTDLENLCTNGRGDSLEGWSGAGVDVIPTGFTFWPDASFPRSAIDVFARDTFFGPPIPVTPGQEFHCSCDTLPFGGLAANFDFRIGLRMRDANGVDVSFLPVAASRAAAVSGYRRVSSTITIPSGVASATMWVQVDKPSTNVLRTSGSGYHITNVRYQRRNGGELIVDGAITAQKLLIQPGGPGTNAITNDRFNGGMDGWRMVEGSGTWTWVAAYGAASVLYAPPGAWSAIGFRSIRVNPGERWRVRMRIGKQAASATGSVFVRMNESNAAAAANQWIGNAAESTSTRTSFTDVATLASLTTVPTGPNWDGGLVIDVTYTVPAGVAYVTPSLYSWDVLAGQGLILLEAEFSRQVGTTIIEPGAIITEALQIGSAGATVSAATDFLAVPNTTSGGLSSDVVLYTTGFSRYQGPSRNSTPIVKLTGVFRITTGSSGFPVDWYNVYLRIHFAWGPIGVSPVNVSTTRTQMIFAWTGQVFEFPFSIVTAYPAAATGSGQVLLRTWQPTPTAGGLCICEARNPNISGGAAMPIWVENSASVAFTVVAVDWRV